MAGASKQTSSTTQHMLLSPLPGIYVTPGAGESDAKMFPNVILALRTWNNGISGISGIKSIRVKKKWKKLES